MKIREYFNEVQLNPEERKYLTKKLNKIEKSALNNFKSNEILAELRIDQNKKSEWTIKLIIDVPRDRFEVSKKGFGLTEVMDELEEVITQQIFRKKEKIKDLRERGQRSLRKKRTIDEKARF
jgi:ribosome-associated translation inhibitor RaiA